MMPEQALVTDLSADALEARIPDLARLLQDCVHAGASVGFILPFPIEESRGFWRDSVLPAVRGGKRLVLVACQEERILATAQLDWDTPANQPHRAEARKLLVHPDARRQGLARALMVELEGRVRALGRSLITLDTRTGDAAEPLYLGLGYRISGTIPGYCLDARTGALDGTTIMYKAI